MTLSSDGVIFYQCGWIKLNLTLVTTWALMLFLWLLALTVCRGLPQRQTRSRLQNMLEVVLLQILDHLEELGLKPARRYLPFIGTLFLFIAVSNLAIILPGYQAPTGSLSTTTALAVAVAIAVPFYGIRSQGLRGYLASYLKPVWIMLPFNLIGELSRTVALAIRLFGNMMSGAMIGAILLLIAPLLFPLMMNALGLLTGMVQAYIFTVLAMVYIAAAIRIHPD